MALLCPTAQAHTPSQDTAKAPHDPSSAMEINPAQTHNQAFHQTAFTHPSGDYYFDKCRLIPARIILLEYSWWRITARLRPRHRCRGPFGIAQCASMRPVLCFAGTVFAPKHAREPGASERKTVPNYRSTAQRPGQSLFVDTPARGRSRGRTSAPSHT